MPITLNASTSSGLVTTPDNSGQIAFQNNGITELTVNAFGIGLGTAVPSSGTGITFPAVQDPSSNANTLDDYEEGTWLPEFLASGGTATYTARTGSYTKIGRQVTVMFHIAVNPTTLTGVNGIIGLPFTAASSNYGGVSFSSWETGGMSGQCNITGLIASGVTQIQLRFTNSATQAPATTTLNFSTTTVLAGSLTYFTA